MPSERHGGDGARQAGAGDARRHAPATHRNRDAIVAAITPFMPPAGLVLEVASGTGEHIVHFALHWPQLDFQPSDPDPELRASIAAWTSYAGLANVRTPIDLDTRADSWPVGAVDAIFCANMIHIAPWPCAEGLIAGAGRSLGPGRHLLLYGPFKRGGAHTAPSNEAFDRSLRANDPSWGVRDLGAVERIAADHGLGLRSIVEMPANNLTIAFEKD